VKRIDFDREVPSRQATTQAVVLAGGLGRRLGPLVGHGNKPMVQVAGKPFLEYLLLHLKKYGVTRIILCVGYRGHVIHDYFGSGGAWGLDLTYSWERDLLGTAGALRLALPAIEDKAFFVVNGDSFFDVDLRALAHHHVSLHALATLALVHVTDASRYGTVLCSDDGAVSSFVEKGRHTGSAVINAGVYMLEPGVLHSIPSGRAVSLEREVFPSLIGKHFFGMPGSGYFVDIGVPDDCTHLQADPNRLLQSVA